MRKTESFAIRKCFECALTFSSIHEFESIRQKCKSIFFVPHRHMNSPASHVICRAVPFSRSALRWALWSIPVVLGSTGASVTAGASIPEDIMIPRPSRDSTWRYACVWPARTPSEVKGKQHRNAVQNAENAPRGF